MSLGCLGITDCLKCPTNPSCNPDDDSDDDDDDKCLQGTFLVQDKCLCKDTYLFTWLF